MMIKNLISFGIFMMIENIIIMYLLIDLIRRASIKLKNIRHPHIYWKSGMILVIYLLFLCLDSLPEFYSCMRYYVFEKNPLDLFTVVARVSSRSWTLVSTLLLYHYTMIGEFNLFKNKNNESN